MGGSNADVARRTAEAYARGDTEAALRDISPDVVYDMTQNSPEGGEWDGHDGLAAGLGTWEDSWEDYSIEVREVIEGTGDQVVVVIHQRGRGRESGIAIDWVNAYVNELKDGKITRITPYPSKDAALAAVGA